jgi:CubicO group peptidase (beta-lactamase class C family)
MDTLRAIRAACAGFGGILVKPEGADGTKVQLLQPGGRQTTLTFRLEHDAPYRITALELGPTELRVDQHPVPPLTWDTLERGLEAEVTNGFSGTVLAVHDDKIVLHRGFGLANREKQIPNGVNTVFGIGSVPIDFTRAAILKLEELGKLRTSDPITRFLPDVPADKRAMTIDHLMSGRSGLPNFHDIRGVDSDPDLSWIDRDTAIRRILGQDLLFAPGQDEAHSHSAWVLLAAIVEIVSKRSYEEFLQQNFFGPADMTRTGLHEDAARFGDDEFAIGYDGQSVGRLNCPKYWGRTSWLVMGSGGMVSTPGDLYRWVEAIRSGKTLSPAYAARFWSHGPLAGGDMRGYFCLYTEGPGDWFVLCSNAHSGPGAHAHEVGGALEQLVMGGPPPAFSLGIEFDVTPEGGVRVRGLRPGGAAEAGGLKPGDVIVSAAGRPLKDPVMPVLTPLLRTGDSIAFVIERDGARQTITIKPQPRN